MSEITKGYYSIAEYVAITGLSLSTVHRRLREGLIPKYQPGGPHTRVLIPIGVLDVPAVHLTPAVRIVPAEPPTPSAGDPPKKLPGRRAKWRKVHD